MRVSDPVTFPVLELRKYEIAAGRRADFDRRIRKVAMPLFRRLRFRLHGYWAEADNPLIVFYTLTWTDAEEMNARWAEFGTTPEWKKAKVEYDAPGPLVVMIERHLLRPAIAGPLVPLVAGPAAVWEWERE